MLPGKQSHVTCQTQMGGTGFRLKLSGDFEILVKIFEKIFTNLSAKMRE